MIDNLSTGFRWAVADDVPFAIGDVADAPLIDRLIAEHGVGAILHFAGSVVVPESVADPLKYYRNNTVASRTLIERAVAGGVARFIFSSTAAVYGTPQTAPSKRLADPPINPYGRSKLMTEIMLADVAAAHGLKAGVLRYFNVAGADPDGRAGQSTQGATHLIKVGGRSRLRQARGGHGVRRRLSHARRHRGARLHPRQRSGRRPCRRARGSGSARAGSFTLNCGYGRGFSVLEVLDAVERAAGAPLARRMGPRRPGDPAALIADNRQILQRLPWRPRRADLDLIVADALRWERSLDARPASSRN